MGVKRDDQQAALLDAVDTDALILELAKRSPTLVVFRVRFAERGELPAQVYTSAHVGLQPGEDFRIRSLIRWGVEQLKIDGGPLEGG